MVRNPLVWLRRHSSQTLYVARDIKSLCFPGHIEFDWNGDVATRGYKEFMKSLVRFDAKTRSTLRLSEAQKLVCFTEMELCAAHDMCPEMGIYRYGLSAIIFYRLSSSIYRR